MKTKPKPLPEFHTLPLKSGSVWALEAYFPEEGDYVQVNVQFCGKESPRPYLKGRWNLKPVRRDLAFSVDYLEDYDYLEVCKALLELSSRYLTSIREREHLIAVTLINLVARIYSQIPL